MNLRDIDYLIATEIMGWKLYNYNSDVYDNNWKQAQNSDGWCWSDFQEIEAWQWSPTTDIKQAFKAIEKLDNLFFNIGRESCMGTRYDLYTYDDPDMKDKVSLTCEEDLPLAICKLALSYRGISYE